MQVNIAHSGNFRVHDEPDGKALTIINDTSLSSVALHVTDDSNNVVGTYPVEHIVGSVMQLSQEPCALRILGVIPADAQTCSIGLYSQSLNGFIVDERAVLTEVPAIVESTYDDNGTFQADVVVAPSRMESRVRVSYLANKGSDGVPYGVVQIGDNTAVPYIAAKNTHRVNVIDKDRDAAMLT